MDIIEQIKVEILNHIGDIVFERCEGCFEEYANQLGHTCLTLTEEERIDRYFDEAVNERLNKGNALSAITEFIRDRLSNTQVSERLSNAQVFEVSSSTNDGQ